jgi:threonine synthase
MKSFERGDWMKYMSTRGQSEKLDAAGAIIKGLAADGGLFVPDNIPQVGFSFIKGLVHLTYVERARRILSCFLTDYTEDELEGCVMRAYGGGKFDDGRIAPLQRFDDVSVLELWHGPTSAFKDMALQLLPQLMGTALKKTGEKAQVLILVATSGDTGKAALEGFKDVDQISIQVFYPEGGVSQIQHLQMASQAGHNVSVIAVKGNFDDAQSGVKKIFSDDAFNAILSKEYGTKLSSANSINWGRLAPQIVYYFSTYADLLDAGKIAMGDAVDFTVPTGNFGDILAGYYAKSMGLPVHRLICASNANNVLTDFLQTGIYDRNREFFKTISPSMDILVSSNLERLLYHITGSAEQVKGWMDELAVTGRYDVGAEILAKIKETFWAGYADDDSTQNTIYRVYKQKDYVLDTHTAVAWKVAEDYQKKTGDKHEMIVVSTASPYKFNESVLSALGVSTKGLDGFQMLDELGKINTNHVPKGLESLRNASIIHTGTCEKSQMEDMVIKSLKIK